MEDRTISNSDSDSEEATDVAEGRDVVTVSTKGSVAAKHTKGTTLAEIPAAADAARVVDGQVRAEAREITEAQLTRVTLEADR